MIKANHNFFAQLIFNPYLKRLLNKNFTNFFLANDFPQIKQMDKLIVTPNHFSWWDGFFVDYVFKKFTRRKLYIMMLEEQLLKYWFFKYLGAFSINQYSPRSVIASSEYTKNILKDENNFVAFFPQGKIEQFGVEKIKLQPGLKIFIPKNIADVKVLPIAFKIQHYEKKNPEVIVRFGKIICSDIVKNDFALFEYEFRNNIRSLTDAAFKREFVLDLFEKRK